MKCKKKLKKNLSASPKNTIFKEKNLKYPVISQKKHCQNKLVFPIFFQSVCNYILKKSTVQFFKIPNLS